MPRLGLRGNLTACVTMGRRPELLTVTLESLGPLIADIPVLAVNDFGDDETNRVFRRLCPHGLIVNTVARLGHHRAVDLMYKTVKTDFVFHFEDDWAFHRTDFLDECEDILEAVPKAAAVCLRDVEEFVDPKTLVQIDKQATPDGAQYVRLDGIHDQWYGYTFNPHIAPKATWSQTGGFSSFKKERHISRHLRTMGHFVPFLSVSACRHIGEGSSVTPQSPDFAKRLKQLLGF